MTLRLIFKDRDNTSKIFPCVEDFTLTDTKVFIYRKVPDRGELREYTDIIKRRDLYRLEVSGL